jgi:hypothetical protein
VRPSRTQLGLWVCRKISRHRRKQHWIRVILKDPEKGASSFRLPKGRARGGNGEKVTGGYILWVWRTGVPWHHKRKKLQAKSLCAGARLPWLNSCVNSIPNFGYDLVRARLPRRRCASKSLAPSMRQNASLCYRTLGSRREFSHGLVVIDASPRSGKIPPRYFKFSSLSP